MAQTMQQFLEDGSVLEIEREGQYLISDMPQPDPRWRATDSNGHEHYAEKPDRGPVTYPTLEEVAGEPYWCGMCEDEHQDTWYECRQCREVVQPGTYVDTTPKWHSTGTYYTLDDEPITKERAEEILNEQARRYDERMKLTARPRIGSRVRLANDTVTVVPTAAAIPDDEVTVMHHGTGETETVALSRLRKTDR